MSEKRNDVFTGVWTALITPFNTQGEVDLPVFRKLVERQIEAGVKGVVPCGTTGESPTLTSAEKKSLVEASLEVTRGTSVQVLAGTGSNNTANSVEFSKWASDQGVAGVLVVTPYYNKPSQHGLIGHYQAIADSVKCDVVLYNVPGRTAVCMEPKTIVELAKHSRISSIKEATADMSFASALITELNQQNLKMNLLTGDDPTFLPFLSVGGHGGISVISNLLPGTIVKMVNEFQKGNLTQAQDIFDRYFELFKGLFIECNPVPIKYAMEYAGLSSCRVRQPLAELTAQHKTQFEAILKSSGLNKGESPL